MTSTRATTRTSLSVGSRHHYTLATELIAAGPGRVVLVQRSSTLVLGPEEGWPTEAAFFAAAWRSIEAGTEWSHIASVEGIARHLRRPTSRFPDRAAAEQRLIVNAGTVALPGPGSKLTPIKNIDALPPQPDLKIDRQARLLIADFVDRSEALIVENVGQRQVTLRFAASEAAELFELVHDLWCECAPLTELDIIKLSTLGHY